MEETLLKSLEHTPDLLVLTIIVIAFVKFLKIMHELNAKTISEIMNKHAESDRIAASSRDQLIAELRKNSEETRALSATYKEINCRYPNKH